MSQSPENPFFKNPPHGAPRGPVKDIYQNTSPLPHIAAETALKARQWAELRAYAASERASQEMDKQGNDSVAFRDAAE